MSEPYDVSTPADLARGRRVLVDRIGQTYEVCADCRCTPACCICHRGTCDWCHCDPCKCGEESE